MDERPEQGNLPVQQGSKSHTTGAYLVVRTVERAGSVGKSMVWKLAENLSIVRGGRQTRGKTRPGREATGFNEAGTKLGQMGQAA